MNSSSIFIFILFLLTFSNNSKCLEKRFVPNINFDNPKSWMEERVPCPLETIVFPKNFTSAVTLPKEIFLPRLVLPPNGFLIMDKNFKMVLSQEGPREINAECRKRKKEIHYKQPKPDLWFLSKNWEVTSGAVDKNMNPAVPHQELIPCDYETVFFPPENNVYVDIQDAPTILANKIVFDGDQNIHNFINFVNYIEIGQAIFLNHERTYITQNRCYDGYLKCACHTTMEQKGLMGVLCENEKQFCGNPKCDNPIQPIGHCCKICASTIMVNSSDLTIVRDITFNLKASNLDYDKNLHIHISLVNVKTSKGLFEKQAQIVAVDKGEYNEISTKFALDVKEKLKSQYKEKLIALQFAGRAIYTGQNNSWIIVFATLFIILFAFGAIYFYHYPNLDWIEPMRLNNLRLFSSPFVFARFENTMNDGNEYENITVGVSELSETDTATGFAIKNPMYEATTSTNTEDKKQSGLAETVSYKKAEDDDIETGLEEINIIENIE